MPQKILIIGANGFIGKNLVKYFAHWNVDIVAVDQGFDKLDNTSKNVEYFAVNVHHTKELISVCDQVDYVIWLVHASIPSTQDESVADDFSINISSVIRFLEGMKHSKRLKKFIYLSSGGTVYGNVSSHTPINEQHRLNPISEYGLSKIIIENYISYLTKNNSFESVILRPSNVYGPYQNLVKAQGVIGFAFKAVLNNLVLDLYDGGRVIRDFVYVEDLARAIESFLCDETESGKTKIYNIGTGVGFSVKQIIEKIEKISGKKLIINNKTSRSFDCEYNVLDSSKLQKEKGWKAEVDIDSGLQKVWEWIETANK